MYTYPNYRSMVICYEWGIHYEERQKILVVDDSKFNQELIMEILGEKYQHVVANDGLEAIKILQKDWTIDLMLLDINMPKMNGFEVLGYMHQYHWIKEFPVIVISAEEENSIIEKGYLDGLVANDIPISAQVVSIADVFDALISNRVYKDAYDYKTAIQMILDGKCGCFNPLLLECLKEMGTDIYVAFKAQKDDYKDYYEAKKLSGEILKSEILPYNNHAQCIIDFLHEKMEYFEMSDAKELFDYNPLIGELTIIDRQNHKKYKKDILEFISFEVNEEVIDLVQKHLDAASIDNKEFSIQIQDCNITFHTLWYGLDEERYIGIIGTVDRKE